MFDQSSNCSRSGKARREALELFDYFPGFTDLVFGNRHEITAAFDDDMLHVRVDAGRVTAQDGLGDALGPLHDVTRLDRVTTFLVRAHQWRAFLLLRAEQLRQSIDALDAAELLRALVRAINAHCAGNRLHVPVDRTGDLLAGFVIRHFEALAAP